MGADVTLENTRLDQIANYSVSEFATSLDPSDMSGGIGQITVNLNEVPEASYRRGKQIKIEDTSQGVVTGTLTSKTSSNGFAATLSADSRLLPLTYTRTALPFKGTLDGLIRYYLALVGITSGIVVDSSLASQSVTVPGWNGVVLDAFKRICAARHIELSLVSNNVVVRPVRQRIASNLRNASISENIDDTNLAQEVEVFYLHSIQHKPSTLVYPAGGWHSEVQIISVDADEEQEVEIDLTPTSGETGLGVSVESIVQPTCVDYVAAGVNDQSAYSVVGNDGKIVPAARWKAFGGKLEVEVGKDTRTLIVRVTGSSEKELAPFRIAAASGTSDFYSSLRVMGAAVVFDKRSISALTGISPDVATQELVQVESEFIVGIDSAWRAVRQVLGAWTGPQYSISVNARGINRVGDTGEVVYPTIADFNALYSGKTIGDFNAEWTGKTIAHFNAAMLDLVSGNFENQAFGNISGTRVEHDGTWFRITEGTVTQAGVNYTAVRDTTVGDWNAHYAGMTIADFNARAAGLTLGDLALQPLIPVS